jgi:pSer/pThr/pTyr-binding forkhead associated (FHA) protein
MKRKLNETSLIDIREIGEIESCHCDDTGTNEIPREKLEFAPPGTEKAFLRVLEGPAKDRIIYLSEDPALIGRDPQCDIQLPDHSISRRHARVVFQYEDFVLEDLDSTNGTFVNGIRIVKCVLRQKDTIHLGNVKMVFSEELLLSAP